MWIKALEAKLCVLGEQAALQGTTQSKGFSTILFVKNSPVVILLRLAAKTAKTFISKMRNDGATKIVERTETVPEAVEESVSDSFNHSLCTVMIFKMLVFDLPF